MNRGEDTALYVKHAHPVFTRPLQGSTGTDLETTPPCLDTPLFTHEPGRWLTFAVHQAPRF